jgi:hypothetical protein
MNTPTLTAVHARPTPYGGIGAIEHHSESREGYFAATTGHPMI